jgi:YD repeat-containing protein
MGTIIMLINKGIRSNFKHKIMKTRCLLLVCLAGMLLFTTCKKDKLRPVPMVQCLTDYFNNLEENKTTFFYDKTGHLIREVFIDHSYTTIVYSDASVIETSFDSTGVVTETTNLTLNAQGLAASAVITPSGKKKNHSPLLLLSGLRLSEAASTTLTFEYDADGYLVKQVQNPGQASQVTSVRTILNGNCIKEVDTYPSAFYTYTYEYLADKNYSFGMENTGVSFLGRQNKNLCSVQSRLYGTMTTTTKYAYEFDNEDRVTKRVINSSTTSYTGFVYQEGIY